MHNLNNRGIPLSMDIGNGELVTSQKFAHVMERNKTKKQTKKVRRELRVWKEVKRV